MQAVIDLGNSFGKIGWFEGNSLIEAQHHIPFENLETVLQKHPFDAAILSSTSHDTSPLAKKISSPRVAVYELSPSLPVPILKDYDTPHTLGADRVAAAVGAAFMFPQQHSLIIDAGTCITYDWQSESGAFEGGIISLGLRMRLKAMHTFTKRLPDLAFDTAKYPTLIGKNTTNAMYSGAINGMIAEINGIIERYLKEKGKCNILVCGGDAPYFENRLNYPIFALPNLVLVGLNQILRHNVLQKKQ
jgi:type III pantothenate kinase